MDIKESQTMESGSQIIEIWQVFKEYIDKKNIETVAERFVDVCADFGTSDESFREALGSDSQLDKAIGYYLEEDIDDDDYGTSEDDDWD